MSCYSIFSPDTPEEHDPANCSHHLPDAKQFIKKHNHGTKIICNTCGRHWRLGRVYAPWGPEMDRHDEPTWYDCPDLDKGIDW